MWFIPPGVSLQVWFCDCTMWAVKVPLYFIFDVLWRSGATIIRKHIAKNNMPPYGGGYTPYTLGPFWNDPPPDVFMMSYMIS